MITKDNFRDLLVNLNFKEDAQILYKNFDKTNTFLKVDFQHQKLIYPERKGLIINEKQITNFSRPENFVVFECVHRLLEKGYKPEHIELEPRWKVGHGPSGGRADILVKNQENNPLLLIECKTPGREFKKAWDETLNDGGQLFTYAQQISQTQFLALYTSDFEPKTNELTTKQRIISHKDNQVILSQDENLKPFAQATNVQRRYQVWKETYKLEFTEKGIFEENIQPYQIGKSKYTLRIDTKPIDATDKKGKYHDFRTFLRKHNIARRENAFEVLVNLFLCKIVDEEQNKNDLKFYWKGMAYDNYFDFVDRLQDLYQIGMREFLNEEITYISNRQIDEAFWTVKNKRNATKKEIQKYFRQLKFFTNNAFSFIDTSNRQKFERNVKVLVEIVQMWQNLRLKTKEQNQFLGDMFEYFLDNSIKQSEGQFFTPLPICKFIVTALPLETQIQETSEPLKVIDYACGAGHFLTEYAQQIKPLVEKYKEIDLSRYYETIFGIEKEDRLAKISKVSAYMFGQDQIQILDQDALDNIPEIQANSCNILVANPPFAVEDFLKNLPEKQQETYQLHHISGLNSGTNNIQCFFIERAKQILAPNGLVGIIVPSSVLSNSDAMHIATREILLKFFDIVSIVELGNGTFGKTGTNTVILFLRRKARRPEPAQHYSNRVQDFFEGIREGDKDLIEYQDLHWIRAYCEHTELPYESYRKFLNLNLTGWQNLDDLEDLLKTDIFKDYQADFQKTTAIKNLKKKSIFKKKSAEEKKEILTRKFIAYLYEIEQDKLLYFILAQDNPQEVLIVKSPSNNKEQKQFLGYEWSGTKGKEGIKYYGGETVHDIITPLFDPKNRDNADKISFAIRQNFTNNPLKELPQHCTYASLTDMLDFSRKDFSKAFSLTPKKKIQIQTKWDLVKLGTLCELPQYGANEKAIDGNPIDNYRYIRITDIDDKGNLNNDFKTVQNVDKKYILDDGDFLFARSGNTVGKTFLYKSVMGKALYAGYLIRFKTKRKELLPEYLNAYTYMNIYKKWVNHTQTGTSQPNINAQMYSNMKIPLPPLKVQNQIVEECETIDKETQKAEETVQKLRAEIEEKVQQVYESQANFIEIRKVSVNIQYGLNEKMNTVEKGYKIFRMNEIIAGRMNDNGQMKYADILEEEFQKYKLEKGDILFNRTNSIEHVGKTGIFDLEGNYCFASYLIRIKTDEKQINSFFLNYMMNSNNFQREAKSKASKSINQVNINATIMGNIEIPVPSLSEQKKLVAKLEKIENQIAQNQEIIAKASSRKQAVMEKYL